MRDFTSELEQNGHHIYCDSYFSNLGTAEALAEAKHKFTICCQANRPASIWSKKLHTGLHEKGDIQWTSHPSKEILAVSWQDNNKVNILTNTVSEPHTVLRCKMKSLGERRVFRIKSVPDVVVDYRTGMGCVDRANAKSNRYMMKHRVRKWPRAAFFGLLQMMITDAWLIYKCSRNNDVDRKLYLKMLIDELAMPTRKRKRLRSRGLGQAKKKLPHMPILVKKELRGTCLYCEQQARAANKKVTYGNCLYVCLACSKEQKAQIYLHTNKEALWHGVDLSSLDYAKELN